MVLVPEPPPDEPIDGTDAPTDNVAVQKPTGYDRIYPRLKDRRKAILIALDERDGEASVSVLRAEDGANVPPGSLDMHLAWLRGERRNGDARDWWPEDVDALSVEVGREVIEGNETRMIGLTDYGESFVRYMRRDEDGGELDVPHAVEMAVESHSNQIESITNEIDQLRKEATQSSTQSDDGVSEERIEELEDRMDEITDKLSKHDEALSAIKQHLTDQ